jgi:hypothetical protein
MVSVRSRLYAEHPDWVYAVAERPNTEIRQQLLLDVGRPEVERFAHSIVDSLLRRYEIGYLKRDFNRPVPNPAGPSRTATSGGSAVTAADGGLVHSGPDRCGMRFAAEAFHIRDLQSARSGRCGRTGWHGDCSRRCSW